MDEKALWEEYREIEQQRDAEIQQVEDRYKERLAAIAAQLEAIRAKENEQETGIAIGDTLEVTYAWQQTWLRRNIGQGFAPYNIGDRLLIKGVSIRGERGFYVEYDERGGAIWLEEAKKMILHKPAM